GILEIKTVVQKGEKDILLNHARIRSQGQKRPDGRHVSHLEQGHDDDRPCHQKNPSLLSGRQYTPKTLQQTKHEFIIPSWSPSYSIRYRLHQDAFTVPSQAAKA